MENTGNPYTKTMVKQPKLIKIKKEPKIKSLPLINVSSCLSQSPE